MKPWLWLPAKLAHDLSPLGLQMFSAFSDSEPPRWKSVSWGGLEFPNPLGVAGGVDKDGERIEDWWAMGAGFVEIGTVTPKPQGPNPGKIIDRDIEAEALWNRMGFPGRGVWHVHANLKDLPEQRLAPVFVNIGKNRDTPNEKAASDYAACLEALAGLADGFVVNISSPNTTGLRDLFRDEVLRPFLAQILATRNRTSPATPVLLKLSPDLQEDDLNSVVRIALETGIEGFIATNTTLSRYPGSTFSKEGGVSGRPLASLSRNTLKRLVALLDSELGSARKEKLIVSVGGVMTPEDVFDRLSLGADLVQVYTALVFEGPRFFHRVAKQFGVRNEAPALA